MQSSVSFQAFDKSSDSNLGKVSIISFIWLSSTIEPQEETFKLVSDALSSFDKLLTGVISGWQNAMLSNSSLIFESTMFSTPSIVTNFVPILQSDPEVKF